MTERRDMEKKWSKEKYLVMYHSQAHYEKIREALKGDCTPVQLDQLINEAKQTPPTAGSRTNAFQHMWGYFKKTATPEEREEYSRLQQNGSGQNERERLAFIRSLAEKYNVQYLLDSTVLR
ncbi:YbgA family protein [Bhargavaea ullalensis]|uniref:Uncharacterized protein YbgA (DUF1722 family) n=1 Tax=Bhargavaea ullalensis TaxID=1265685 RepID=A0ABV2GE82_9BACL